jgi:hypothetical protein
MIMPFYSELPTSLTPLLSAQFMPDDNPGLLAFYRLRGA